MDLEGLGISDEELERYVVFERGAVPCIFRIQAEEGLCRFNVTSRENLNILLTWCEERNYRVEWTSAVLKETAEADAYVGFPGGMYVAHRGAADED